MKPHPQTPLPICFPRRIAMLILLLLSSISMKVKAHTAEAIPSNINITRHGCQDTCGNGVRIPFPFGIGANCSLDSWYEIECKAIPPSNTSTKPFLSIFNVEVLEMLRVDITGALIQAITVSIPPLKPKVCTVDMKRQRVSSPIDLRGSPYNFSTDDNILIMEGCTGSTVLVDQSENIIVGCSTVCSNNNNTAIPRNKCYGIECCQTQLPTSVAYSPLQSYHIDFYGQSFGEQQSCMVATLIKNDSANQYLGKLLPSMNSDPPTVQVELLWSWVSSGSPSYDPLRATCNRDETNNETVLCTCNRRLHGNPYVYDGCQDLEVCRLCGRGGYCHQSRDDMPYHCGPDYGWSDGIYVTIVVLGLISIALGPVLLVFCCRCLYRCKKRRSKTERRVKTFKHKLQQHQSTSEGVVERTKLFTHKQLDKATNHFNESRILGKGGQGIVYKGMLNDGRTVAVKKLKKMDESEMEQLITEVVILSQINHRNVVKLLGCCLEKEVPLLVYEFISNGTLSHLIHDPDEDFVLSWPMRLKIAAGAAGAISYLHSYSSIPIYHRDIKSSNILLDDKYRAKVSDFGSSKTTSIDQTHLTTLVRGTMGYLDPEYFQSNQFTDKSDVYSFGVVLSELLTGKKPIYKDETMGQKSLVSEFLLMIRNSQLFDILDPQVVNEAKPEELVAVADLAKRCLKGIGRLRPSMNEVTMTLEMIIKSPTEFPAQDQQSFSVDEEFDENVMPEISDIEFTTSPLPSGDGSSLYIDVQPLMRDTI